MLNNLKQRKEEGFTIIEVMIVLAIAGLIMVIVFLAVPALQRNSRNTALNTDANNLLSAVGEYASNNGGSLPTTITLSTNKDQATVSGAGSNDSVTKLGGNIIANPAVISGSTGTPLTTSSAVGTVQLVTGPRAECNSTGTGLAGTSTSGNRSYALLYVAEGGNGAKILKCIGG